MLLRGASAILSYSLSIILARLLGASEFGNYVYAITWVSVLSIPATFGFDRLVVRELAVYKSYKEWAEAKGLIFFSIKIIFLQSLFILSLAYLVTIFVINFTSPQLYKTLLVAFIAIPLYGFINFGQGVLRGLGRVVYSQMPSMFISPLLLLFWLGVYVLIRGTEINAFEIIVINIISTATLLCILGFMVKKYIPEEIFITRTISYKKKKWLGSAAFFVALSGMHIISSRTDIIMLGILKTSRDVGYYSVAVRLSDILTFILLSVNGTIAPTIASLYSRGEKEKLQKFITRSARLVFYLALPSGILLFIFGKWLLLLFGNGFVNGLTSLRILVIAQLVNISCGSVGLILNMTGNERITAFGVVLSALVNIVFNLVLIPVYGKEGAAIATGVSTIVWNIVLLLFIKNKLSLNTTAFSRLS